MNERIKDFVLIAKHYANSDIFAENDVQLWQARYNEKFAELIVKECMDLALAEQKRYANLNITHINMAECAVTVSNFRLLIKEHFGVEE